MNVRQAIGAMRASVLLRAVVGHPAAVEEPPVAAAVAEVDHGAVVAEEDGEQEIEKNKSCRLLTDHWQLITDD